MGRRSFKIITLAALVATGLACDTQPVHQTYGHRVPDWISRDAARNAAPETQLLKKLMWPVTYHRITQEFKPDGFGRPHDGIDIAAPQGARIYAPANGRVVYAGHKFHGYGKMIIVEHNQHLATIYGHLQKLLVHSGDFVERGSLIGLVGHTGRATGSHLHFEVRWDHAPVDPLEFLPR